jgi:hypothetical protein
VVLISSNQDLRTLVLFIKLISCIFEQERTVIGIFAVQQLVQQEADVAAVNVKIT